MYTLIEKTLKKLHQNSIDATPKNYAKEFYKQAEKQNFDIEDRKNLDAIINSLCQLEKEHLKENEITTATELVDILKDRTNKSQLVEFIKNLSQFLKPSIDQKVFKELEVLIEDLVKNPEKLTNKETLELIRTLTETRVSHDRKALVEKSEDMKKLTTLLSKYYDKSLIQSCNTADEVSVIKSEIEALELSEHSDREITSLKKQLVDTIYRLENSIEENKIQLIKGQNECSAFEGKIKALQEELSEVKKEKFTDYLTGVLNRRGFDTESVKIENAYEMFGSKYAIVFYDIDDFKKVNDTYGHDCGDVILNTFGSILNKLTREDDVIARYGGEEFVALLHYKDEDEIVRYTKRVKEIISKNKFVYKNDVKLKLKFSAGVAYRSNYQSFEKALKKADLLLYNAKHSGKDKIIFDNDKVV